MSNLPTSAAARKAVPIFSGVVRYFPRALAAVAELSRVGNEQHNPGKPLHWDRSKSTDELDALTRHLVEAGTVDTDNVRHSTKVAWRALANLEKELEAAEAAAEVPGPNPVGYLPPDETVIRVTDRHIRDREGVHSIGSKYRVRKAFRADAREWGEGWIVLDSAGCHAIESRTVCRVEPTSAPMLPTICDEADERLADDS